MKNTYCAPIVSGLMSVAKVNKSNQRFTYVNELNCSHDERYLAAIWLSVAPEKRYSTKEFNLAFKEMQEEESQ
jgi:hypothetical protein